MESDELLLNEYDVAEAARVSVSTVRRWRYQGGYGPPALKIPRHPLRGYDIRYRPADVAAFLDAAATKQE